jgi:hypothetical protein
LKARRSWIRALHSFAFALSNLLVSTGFYRVVSNPSSTTYRVIDLKRIPPLRGLWPIIEIVSMLPLILVRVILPSSFLGRFVVSERFTLDSIASITWLTEDPTFPKSFFARILMKLTPRNACLIYLDCDYDEILKRRGNIAEPEKFIEIQRQIYGTLAKQLPVWTINTSLHKVEETHLMIREHVIARFPKAKKLRILDQSKDQSVSVDT